MPIGYSNLLSQLLQVSSDSLASFSIMPIAHTYLADFYDYQATIVAGTLAERCQMRTYLMYSMLLTGFGKYASSCFKLNHKMWILFVVFLTYVEY